MPVDFNIIVKLDLDELGKRLSAEQVTAVCEGISQVLIANPYADANAALDAPKIEQPSTQR